MEAVQTAAGRHRPTAGLRLRASLGMVVSGALLYGVGRPSHSPRARPVSLALSVEVSRERVSLRAVSHRFSQGNFSPPRDKRDTAVASRHKVYSPVTGRKNRFEIGSHSPPMRPISTLRSVQSCIHPHICSSEAGFVCERKHREQNTNGSA